MYLAYFDESKQHKEKPFFYIGGIIIHEQRLTTLEKSLGQIAYNFFGAPILSKSTEFHGVDIFHGKGPCKGKKLADRMKLLEDICGLLVSNEIAIRVVCIDVKRHRGKYKYPEPEYRLGLMLILERICDYLETVDNQGIVFGDYEEQEVTRSVLDFSQFKGSGKTPMYFGRPLGRLKDTIYFTHSHHSRFLQVADVVMYLANRFESATAEAGTWHETKARECWEALKASTDYRIQVWP